MAHPPVAGEVGDEDLAAPDGAVGPEAEAVEGDAQDRALCAGVGQAGGDVGVVVLDADQLDTLPRSSSSAHLVDRYSGWRSWATTSGRTSKRRLEVLDPSRGRSASAS